MKTKAYYYTVDNESKVYFDKVTKFTKYLRNNDEARCGVEVMTEEEFKNLVGTPSGIERG